MQWDAMRSIALAGSRKSPLPVELEIADENFPLIIPWRRVPLTGLLPGWRYKPVLPTETYSQQTDAILAYVLARTGLPLHDIRDDQ
jgi:hypothetical protein